MQVSMAGDMATWLVAHSQMHPDFSELPVMYDMTMGGFEDPTTRNTASRFEGLILQLQVCCTLHKHAAAVDQWGLLRTDYTDQRGLALHLHSSSCLARHSHLDDDNNAKDDAHAEEDHQQLHHDFCHCCLLL